jgi:hypothetical protein
VHCSDKCHERSKRTRLRLGDQEYCAGGYLLFMRGEQSGLILCSHTYALRMRTRTARASCSEGLEIVGIVPADRARAERFRRAFVSDRVRGSWYRESPALTAYIARRTKPIPRAVSQPLDETTAPAVGADTARLVAGDSGQEQHGGEEAA